MPRTGEILPELLNRMRGDRGRDRDGDLSAGRGRDDLRQELCQDRRDEADDQEQTDHDRQTVCPPRLEYLLAEQNPCAVHAAAPLAPVRPTRRRKTSSSVGRTRSKTVKRTPDSTTNGS